MEGRGAPRARYGLLAAALLVLMGVRAWHGVWSSDFWEHAAVVRELAAHPWAPRHPLLLSDAPHAFFSPYGLAVAVLAKTTGLAPKAALAAAGMASLVGFVLVLPAAVGALFRDVDRHRVAFYGLLLLLFLAAPRAWVWSGFVHLAALGRTFPYPSTFALVLTLGSLPLLAKVVETNDRRLLAALVALDAVVLLTHPTTWIVLVALQVALLVDRTEVPLRRRALLAAGLPVAAFLVAMLWPYYPVARLFLESSPDFHLESRFLYEDVLAKTWPALVGLPVVLWLSWRRRTSAVGIAVAALLVVYAAGWAADRWGPGRVVSNVMMLLQLAAGWALARGEEWLVAKRPERAALVERGGAALVGMAMLLLPGNFDTIRRGLRAPDRPGGGFRFLAEKVGPYDVVWADIDTGWSVPAWSGKVVASRHALHFVPDHAARRAAVAAFFDEKTSNDERRRLSARYRASFVLVSRAAQSAPLAAALSTMGETVHEDADFILVKLAR